MPDKVEKVNFGQIGPPPSNNFQTSNHLKSPQLGPELEHEEDPAPLLLLGRLHPPPGNAGEQEVGDDPPGDKGTGTPEAVEKQLLDQSRVKKDIDGRQDDVEHKQLYRRTDCIREEDFVTGDNFN